MVLQWGLQRGCSVVTKSRQEDRMRESLVVEVGEQLTEGEMEEVNGLDRDIRYDSNII